MLRRFALLVGLLTAVFLGSASAQSWKFVKVFPDTNLTLPNGINNGLAVDPAGKIWIAPYAGSIDSLLNSSTGKYVYTSDLFVYNPDGTLNHKYQYFSYGGTTDTLTGLGYGMTTEPDGNILLLKNSLTLRRINYKDGTEMAKIVNPIPGYSSSCASPAEDAAGEIFLQTVVPTYGVGPIALAHDFSSVLVSIDTSTWGNFARNIAVTSSGNDVYAFHIARGAFHYHSSSGTLGTYTLTDTLFDSLVVESSTWDPKTGWLWVSSGNVVSGMPGQPYSGYAWYGFDMTNPDKPVLKDSLKWNGNVSVDPRPRGIAFSPTGDTVYVAAFNASKRFLEMFVRTATAVNEPPNSVPSGYSLSQNYPNPFNPSTRIDYALKATGKVSLIVYDVLGREVATLVDRVQSAGQHSVTFNANNLPSGVYIYSLTTPDGSRLVKKMILMK